MKPAVVFQYLSEHNLPIILSFPLEEEKGHVITGKGVCYVEKIHVSSRVTMGRFHPPKPLYYLSGCPTFSATIDI